MSLNRSAENNLFTRTYGPAQPGRTIVANLARRASFLVALGVIVSLTASLATPQQQRARSSANPSDSLKREVRHELVMLPYYGVFDNLAYRVNGSEVELYGQVTRPTLKSDAEQVVKRIEGVEKVVNNIEVLPVSPMDDRIRMEAYRAIYAHPALNKYALQAVPPIHIIVKNGTITLEGVVANEADKNIAGIQANSVPGVFKVVNNLRVES
jgi:hyperosmotically inducible protein